MFGGFWLAVGLRLGLTLLETLSWVITTGTTVVHIIIDGRILTKNCHLSGELYGRLVRVKREITIREVGGYFPFPDPIHTASISFEGVIVKSSTE